MIRICQNCSHWTRNQDKTEPSTSPYGLLFGKCVSSHFVYVQYDNPVNSNDLAYWDAEQYGAGVRMGEKFGCIYFERGT